MLEIKSSKLAIFANFHPSVITASTSAPPANQRAEQMVGRTEFEPVIYMGFIPNIRHDKAFKWLCGWVCLQAKSFQIGIFV